MFNDDISNDNDTPTDEPELAFKLPSSTFPSSGTADKLEMMTPLEMATELGTLVAIYLAKCYPERQNGLMNLF